MRRYFALITAFFAVFAFYAHAVFGVASRLTSPVCAAGVFGGMAVFAVLGLLEEPIKFPSTASRAVSQAAFVGCVLMCLVSTAFGAADRGMTVNDWGVLAIEVGIPVLIVISNSRELLLDAAGLWCIPFALADAVANILDITGVAHFVTRTGGYDAGYGLHLEGLCGNSFAEGLVAFVAISYLAANRIRWGSIAGFGRLAAIPVLFASLWLSGGRSYTALTLIAFLLIAFRGSWKLPLPFVALAIGGSFLWATFHAPYYDYDDLLRGWLLEAGAQTAAHHPLLGTGALYRDSSSQVSARFLPLMSLGVTESGILDYAIKYGVFAAALLVVSCLSALAGRRHIQVWPVVMLTTLTGALSLSAVNMSFLGALLFYGSLLYCQLDEPQPSVMRRLIPSWRSGTGSRRIEPAIE